MEKNQSQDTSMPTHLDRKLTNLDWEELLLKIRDFTTSDTCRDRILHTRHFLSASEARESQQDVLHALEILASGVRPYMQSLDLFGNWMVRLKKKAVLKSLELRDLRTYCLEILALREVCRITSNPWTKRLLPELFDCEEPLSAIDQILSPQGEIRSDASETLYRLFNEKQKLTRDVQNAMDKIVKDHQMENMLQDKYITTREGRWVIPVKSGMQHFVPGVIHGSSQTKQTVYVEPERLVPANNRLREVELEIEEEIERILTTLSQYLYTKLAEFEKSKIVMEEADIKLAQAQLARQVNAKACEFNSKQFELNELRHPLLALMRPDVVPNHLNFSDKDNILLLSGPNAGGKTVLLKSVGLAAQMARCGLPICAAEGSAMPFFKEIICIKGDQQSLDAELSTFAAHMRALNDVLTLQGPENLILIDEICGSTDPEEGSCLARSFIDEYARRKMFAVITSHLGPLKSGWAPDSGIVNGSLEFNSKTGKPTYQFIPGIPGSSLAIQTAKRVGVNEDIISRALSYLSPESKAVIDQVEKLENMKLEITQLQDQWRKENQKANQARKKYESLLAELEKTKNLEIEKSKKQAERKINEAIDQAKAAQTFERHRNLQEIKYNLPEIIKSPANTTTTEPLTQANFSQRFPPGTRVFLPTLNQDGIVQSSPNAKGEVLVLSNYLRLQIHWSELHIAKQTTNPTSQLVRQSSQISISLADEDKVLDYRGKTVEEALGDLEIELDQAAQKKRDRLKIIHGHGTEALKKAVRSYLSRSMYVKKWKAGGLESGGDGVTWVELL